MNTEFDLKKVLTLLLPNQDRRRVRVAWLFAVLRLVRDIQADFNRVKQAAIDEIIRNGQTIVLERLFRMRFDDFIRIVNEDSRDFAVIGLNAPSLQNLTGARRAPSFSNPIAKRSPASTGILGAVIRIPARASIYQDQIRALLNKYEMGAASIRFELFDFFSLQATPVNNVWRSITYGNGIFVAVSSNGTGNRVMTSPDGINWTIRASAADLPWVSVAFGAGLFVAVANGDQVMTSPDGINWTLRTALSSQWQAVTFANGLFVAVGNDGTFQGIMTSPDGITWTYRDSPIFAAWVSITWGNGLFVAVATNFENQSVITSPDGINWTPRTAPNSGFSHYVGFGNNIFVVTGIDGALMTSPDGINWTLRQVPVGRWEPIAFGNDTILVLARSGANRAMISHDGINWTALNIPVQSWRAAAFARGKFVLINSSSNGFRAAISNF